MTPPQAVAADALQLPDSVSSAQDLQSVIIEIREYAKWQSHASVKQQVSAGAPAAPAPELSPAARQLIETAAGKLDGLMADLAVIKAGAPNMTITLAAPAHASLKRSLVAWCRQNVAQDVLVSFNFNSTILGGMVVRHGSHVYDWSFRRQIMAARGNFPQHLRTTAPSN